MNRFKVNAILASALVLTCSSGFSAESIKDNKEKKDLITISEVDFLLNDGYTDDDVNFLRQKLIDDVDKASQLYSDSVFGSEDGQYPHEAGKELLAAMDEATAFYQGGSTDIDEILEMLYKLEQATNKFLASRIDISTIKTNLLELISECTNVCNTSSIGKEIGDYPEEAKEFLLNSIKTAENVYNGPTKDYLELESALNTLSSAKEQFLNSVITEVDVSSLIFKITEIEMFTKSIETGETPGKYPIEVKSKLDKLIEEANQMIGNCTYKQSEEMIVKLDNAKKELEDSLITYEKINRKELIEQIDIAEKLRDSAVVGNKPGQYMQESLNDLYSAIYVASVVNLDKDASQAMVDSATATLKIKIQEFKDSVIKKDPVNMENLLSLIEQAEKLIKDTPVGDDLHQVPSGEKEKLQKVIDSSKTIANLISPTQQVIDDAAMELNRAIVDFRDAIIKEVDKTELSDEITQAEALQKKVSNMIGDTVGKYPQEDKDEFDKVVTKAKEVLLNDNATQAEVDNMSKKLKEAKTKFENSIIIAITDKSTLRDKINEAEKLLKESIVGNGDGMYPKESYDKLEKILNSAKEVLNNNQATQQMIDAKGSELETAIADFLQSEHTEYKDFKAQLQIKISECLEIYQSSVEGDGIGEHPAKARENFYKEIEKAKGVVDRDGKNSSEYIKALDDLEKAKEKFESEAVSSEDIELYMTEIQTLLKEMSSKIKDADTSSEYGRVPENKKIALSVMFNKITAISQSSETVSGLKEGIKLAEYSISDFDDRSIYIDNKNVVQGRKLTGKIGSSDLNRENVSIVDKKEFIPKAGMAIDIKGAFTAIGTAFIGLSGVMFKKKK